MATKTAPPQSHPAPGKSQFMVDTADGFQPFIPPAPRPIPGLTDDEGNPIPDNPDNPRGGPSLSLPQQATPLTSDQGVAAVEDITDPDRAHALMTVQDGLAPDDPFNPRGTPDYIVEEYGGDPQQAQTQNYSYEAQAELNAAMSENPAPEVDPRQEGTTDPSGAGTANTSPVPLTITPHFDNPQNPRGISSNLCNGVPNNQATNAQKIQDPTPARAPLAATTYPMAIGERVSAGQNRKPPGEVIP